MDQYQVESSLKNGLESLIIRSADGASSAEVLLFGATVISFATG